MIKIFSILLCLIIWTMPLTAEIISTNSISDIQNHLEKATQDTLVVFDCDDVLCIPADQLLQKHHKSYLEKLQKNLEDHIGKKAAEKLYSIIFTQRKNSSVDTQMIPLINVLQDKNIKVLVLTNCPTGRFGKISSMVDWRLNELQKLGYHFEKSWRDTQEKIFEILNTKDTTNPPVFKEGVLFASGISKGEILKAFLEYASIKPKHIIFIDDKQKHLESVAKIAEKVGIEFLGIEYTAVADMPIETLNTLRADFQFQHLEKQHQWLSDTQADAMNQLTR